MAPPKRNAFFAYMQERRKEFEASGKRFPGGWKEVSELISDDWQNLSEEEKTEYKQAAISHNQRMAERWGKAKEKPKENISIIPSSPSQLYSVEPCLKTEVELLTLSEASSVSSTDLPFFFPREDNRDHVLNIFKSKEWGATPIVVCSFTTYFGPEWETNFRNPEVYPAEIGLVAFSLFNGIIDNLGRVIDPGELPEGRKDAIGKAVKELKLPPLEQCAEFASFDSLVTSMQKFLDKYATHINNDELCVFACDTDYELIVGCLLWLYGKAGIHGNLRFRVLSLGLWAHLATAHLCPRVDDSGKTISKLSKSTQPGNNEEPKLTNRTSGNPFNACFVYPEKFPQTQYGVYLLEKDMDKVLLWSQNYKALRELSCVYHYKKPSEMSSCALNKSTRLVYNILEVITISNRVDEHIPGGHYPEMENLQKEKERRFNRLKVWGITDFEMNMNEEPVKEPESPESGNGDSYEKENSSNSSVYLSAESQCSSPTNELCFSDDDDDVSNNSVVFTPIPSGIRNPNF